MFNAPGESHSQDTLHFFPELAFTLHQTGAFDNDSLMTTFFCVMGLQEPDAPKPIPVVQQPRSAAVALMSKFYVHGQVDTLIMSESCTF